MMDFELFSRIISQAAPLTEQVCMHLMGEPMLHPELKKFFDLCVAHDVRIFFVTNGILLKEKQFELLLHPALRQVNFSLHAFHDNFPDKDATDYLGNIFTYTERAFVERPDLYINYRLWDLENPRGELKHNLDFLEAIEKRFQLSLNRNPDVGRHKGRVIKNKLYLHLDTEFTWPSLELPKLGTKGTCYGLESHFGILVDGTVVPCCLDKEGVIPLGNVNENSLIEILNSERAVKMLDGFNQNVLVEEMCQRCPYITRFSK